MDLVLNFAICLGLDTNMPKKYSKNLSENSQFFPLKSLQKSNL